MSSDPPGPILRPEDLGNLPGFLTLGRLLLAVLLPIWTYDRLALFLVLTAAMLSDIVDGMLARRWGLSSRIGAVLDGWIDKIFTVNFAWCLVLAGFIPGWVMLLWFTREILQAIMIPSVCLDYTMGESAWPEPSPWGKVATISLAVAMFGALLDQAWAVQGGTVGVFLGGLVASGRYWLRDWLSLGEERTDPGSSHPSTPPSPLWSARRCDSSPLPPG